MASTRNAASLFVELAMTALSTLKTPSSCALPSGGGDYDRDRRGGKPTDSRTGSCCAGVLAWITVNIPDELAAEARAHGVTPEAYVEAVLARQVAPRAGDAKQRRTPEETRDGIDSLAQLSDRIPRSQPPFRGNEFTSTTIR